MRSGDDRKRSIFCIEKFLSPKIQSTENDRIRTFSFNNKQTLLQCNHTDETIIMCPFYKEDTPNFSDPEMRRAFVQGSQTSKELIQKELDVNRAEQILLRKRIEIMKCFINDLPSSDPQYSMLAAQVQMDQLEIDELKIRETFFIQNLYQP